MMDILLRRQLSQATMVKALLVCQLLIGLSIARLPGPGSVSLTDGCKIEPFSFTGEKDKCNISNIVINPSNTTNVFAVKYNTSTNQCIFYTPNAVDFKSLGLYKDSGSCTKAQELAVTGIHLNFLGDQTTVPLLLNKSRIYHPHICDENCLNRNTFSVNVSEDQITGDKLLTIRICDEPPGSGNHLTILQKKPLANTTDLTLQSVNGNYSILLGNMDIDYDTNSSNVLNFILQASNDRGSIDRNTTLSVHIVDVDDLPPVFTRDVYLCDILEGNYTGSIANCTIVAKDQDKGINDKIIYNITSVSPPSSSQFSIGGTGTLILNGQLDRETLSTYYIAVKAWEQNNTEHFAQTFIVVNVTDKDDNIPVLQQKLYNVSLAENALAGTIVAHISATDADIGKNAEITYTLGDNSGPFSINNSTGIVEVVDSKALDREYQSNFTLHVYAYSNNDARRNAALIVNLEDENDNSPNFTVSSLKVDINKTQALGSINKVTASDPDLGDNGKVRYSLLDQGDSHIFTIDPVSGDISLKRYLNETFEPFYNLSVQAQDLAQDVSKQRASSLPVTIIVHDVNIHSPEFHDFPKNISIREDVLPGTILISLNTSDADPTDELSISITSNVPKDLFTIRNNQQVMLNASLDREKTASYELTVTLSDGKHDTLETATVTVLDVNDNSPAFINATYTFTIQEGNKTEGIALGAILANDSDTGQNGVLNYYIDSNSIWLSNFTINNNTGDLKTMSSLDREALTSPDDMLSFVVYATDGGSPALTGTTVVNVKVTDINDHTPTFTSDIPPQLQFDELTPPGPFLNVSAEDPDQGPNGKIVYKIVSKPSDAVNINNITGELSFTQRLVISPECDNGTIEVSIQACDLGSNEKCSNKQNIIIEIKDINDHEPVFRDRTFSISAPEGRPFNSRLSRKNVTAVDHDCLPENKDIFYWIDEPSKTIQFNATSMTFYATRTIDFDPPQNDTEFNGLLYASNFAYNVTASDSMNFTISVTDNPAARYTFTQASYTTKIPENQENGSCFYHPNVTYLGAKPPMAKAMYTISSQETDSPFTVNAEGFICLGNDSRVDFEDETEQIFYVSVAVKTGRDDPDSCQVEIHVTNVNDVNPTFVKDEYIFEMYENNLNHTLLGQISATDMDNLTPLVYSLQNYTQYFTISPTTGLLETVVSIDYEDENIISSRVFDLTVTVNDSEHINSTHVFVTLKPLNDNTPVFLNQSYFWSVAENTQKTLSIKATDTDDVPNIKNTDGKIQYWANIPPEFLSGNISINNATGALNVINLDREALGDTGAVQFTVLAVDGGSPPRTGVAMVTINVTGTNDNPPLYDPADKNLTVYLEEGQQYKHILQSRATDADIDEGSDIVYSLVSNPGPFTVNKTTGFLSTTKTLWINNTNNGTYSLTVVAKNTDQDANNQGPDTQSINIILLDINNHLPVFTNATYTANISECEKTGTKILSVHADDTDSTAAHNTVRYWLVNDTISSMFHVDAATGDVILTKTLDVDARQAKDQHVLMFKVYASDLSPQTTQTTTNHTVSTDITVSVNNCNDNDPIFTKPIFICSVVIEEEPSDFNCSVTATDADNDTLTYRLLEDTTPQLNDGPWLKVDKTSGKISLLKKIYTNSSIAYKSLLYQVVCNDTKHTGEAVLYITVIDTNDRPPVFSQQLYNISINESLPAGSILNIEITAFDPDIMDLDRLKYSINKTEPTTEAFEINMQNGLLNLTEKLDYEKWGSKEFNITITATDTVNHTAQTVLHVTVLDVNDNAPEFNQTRYVFTLPEGQTVHGGNFSVTATDRDAGVNKQLTYNLTVPEDKLSYFNVTQEGHIQILKPLDREDMSAEHDNGTALYTLTLTALDHGVPSLSSGTEIQIVVTDINDCVPQFSSPNYTVYMEEGSETGLTIATITASDCDFNPAFNNVTYSQLSNSDYFNVTGAGNVVVNGYLNYNKTGNNVHILDVQAHDGKNKNETTVSIHIIDTNDHSPVFTDRAGGYHFNINENRDPKEQMVVIGNLTAKDGDDELNGQVVYTITGGNEENIFYLTNETGRCVIRANKSLDYETSEQYRLTITASDSARIGNRSTATSVIIQVIDENDNNPEFGHEQYLAEVKENTHRGTVIELTPLMHVNDADSSWFGNEGLRYSLLNNTQPFSIDPLNGTISVNGSIDREKVPFYINQLVVKDTNGTGRNDTALLNITVLGVNDEHPVFTSDIYQFNVTECSLGLTVVGNVSATDGDVGVGHELTYSLVKPNWTRPVFVINSDTGSISVVGMLDRENVTEYSLNISVSDGQSMNYTSVQVYIDDVNDNAPQIQGIDISNLINIDVVEETQPGALYTVTSIDADQENTNNSRVTYSIPHDLNDTFRIDENNGTISTIRQLDREKASSYQINVTAQDHGSPPRASCAIINVTLLDINDNSPRFYEDMHDNITASEVFIVEKSPIRSVVAILQAKDPDQGPNGTIKFELVSTEAAAYFLIDDKSGSVTINKRIDISKLVDESLVEGNQTDNAILKLQVLARDGAPTPSNRSTVLNLTVHVEEVNDNAPVFDHQVFKFNLTEEASNGTVVGECSAQIPNDTSPHMTFSLTSGSPYSFSINKTTGQLLTTAPIDREEESHLVFSVRVTDGRTPERTAFALVDVTIEDINDNAPVFVHDNLTLTVQEEEHIYKTVPVQATDADTGSNANITYTLAGHLNGAPVIIDPVSGILTVNGTFDRENVSSYEFEVVATDHGQPKNLSSTTTILLTVLDVNDHSPVFQDLQQHYNVSEKPTNLQIFSVNTTDEDSGWNGRVIYSLLSTDGGPFDIDPFNGSVSVTGQLDYEGKSSYEVVIEARDEGTDPKSSNATVTIYVTDMYDFKPAFPKDIYELSLQVDTSINSVILDLNATDNLVNYSLAEADKSIFRIHSTSGQIYLIGKLDRRTKEYLVHVTATDKLNHTATCLVIVHVKGHYATFPKQTYTVTLPENIDPGVLIDLNTTEELAGEHVKYTIESVEPDAPGVFTITEGGILSSVKKVDREKHEQYVLYISATVAGIARNKRSIDVTSNMIRLVVHVTNTNDNPPVFSSNQHLTFWVPYTARANYVVTKLEATDADSLDGGGLWYNITGGSTDVFGIEHKTGELHTLVAIASTKKNQFQLKVAAYDEKFSAELNITIGVIQPTKQVRLSASMSLQEFRLKQDILVNNMSSILGVSVEVETVQSHVTEETPQRVDLDRIDLMFHAVNKTSGEVILAKDLLKLMDDRSKELSALFPDSNVFEIRKEKTVYDPSAITAAQIGLICVAIFILFGSAIALVVVITSSSKYEKECQEINKLLKENEHHELEFQMNTVSSRHSSNLSVSHTMAATAFNDGFVETEFNDSKTEHQPSTTSKKPVQFEDQEVYVDFDEEPIDRNLPDAVVPRNVAEVDSIIDSGVGHTPADSIIASSKAGAGRNLLDTAGTSRNDSDRPAMTSSPRLQRAEDGEEEPIYTVVVRKSPGSVASMSLADVVETETADDEEQEEEEEQKEEEEQGQQSIMYDNIVLKDDGMSSDDRHQVESTSL